MSDTNLIPIPPAQRWLDFRVKWLPVLVCGAALCGALYVWNRHVFPASMVARVEGTRADVALPEAGVVTHLFVSRFQRVRAGDPIAEVAPADADVARSTLQVVQAEIDLLRSGVSPSIPSQRAAMNYDRIRLDWLRQRVTLATTRTELQLAETQLTRTEQLWKDKIVSDAELDVARTRRDSLLVSFQEHTRLVNELDRDLQTLAPMAGSGFDPANQLRAALAVQERKLKLAEARMAPRLLIAPIGGTVSMIAKWPGEAVGGASPIVTISSTNAERAIGYLRQPFYLTPTTNMIVQVRSRGFQRRVGIGQVLAVGEQLLPISDVLLPPTKYDVTEHGLPILVSLPAELRGTVRPGEFLDVTLLPHPTPNSAPGRTSRLAPTEAAAHPLAKAR